MRKGFYITKETEKVIHIIEVRNGMILDVSKTAKQSFKNLFFFESNRNDMIKHWQFVGTKCPQKYKNHLKLHKKLYEFIQVIQTI